MDQPSLDAVVERLERVERESRWWKVAALLAVVALASVLVMGQARPTTTVEAQHLVIKNADGQIVAWLGSGPSGLPYLSLSDREGWTRISLALHANGEGYVGVWGFAPRATDQNAPPPDRTGAWLSVGPHGGDGCVTVFGPDGRPAWIAP